MSEDKWAEYREAEARWLREGGYKTELEMTMSPAVTRLRTSHDRLLRTVKEVFSLLGTLDDSYAVAIAYRKLRSAIEAEEDLTL